MTAKSLLIVGALGLASLGIASAKSYDITLSSPTMAGNTQLKPGEYKVKLQGTQAVFTDVQTDKSWTVPAKVENNATRFGETRVESSTQGDMAHIHSIDLGGSNTKVEFGQ
ncbi:MAG TPA: hypothetical protein VHY84_21775 [Bryobacteraceae bacterium]|jgi:hypothetical protein|nr:hypothetical protein [Bryobacteraceae bacterium]